MSTGVVKMMTLTSSAGTNPFLQCPGFLKALATWSSTAMLGNVRLNVPRTFSCLCIEINFDGTANHWFLHRMME